MIHSAKTPQLGWKFQRTPAPYVASSCRLFSLATPPSGPLGGIANENNRQDEATYGAGVRWNFHPQWGVFAEWIKNDRIRIDSYVAGIDYRF